MFEEVGKDFREIKMKKDQSEKVKKFGRRNTSLLFHF
jgi:hypothetical protein